MVSLASVGFSVGKGVMAIVGVGIGVEAGDGVGVGVGGVVERVGAKEGRDVCVENGVIEDFLGVHPKSTNAIPERRIRK